MSLVEQLQKSGFVQTVPAEIVEAINSVEEWVALQKAALEGVPVVTQGPMIRNIQAAVAKHYGISINDIVGARRHIEIVLPRMVAIHLARRLTPKSYPEIGRRFGGRDHTTAMHADRKINKMLLTNPSLQASVEMLIEELGGERK